VTTTRRAKSKKPENRLNSKRKGNPNAQLTPEMEAAKFQPGVSGNPGGRPKTKPITDELRQLLDESYACRERRFKGQSNARVLAVRMFEIAIAGDVGAANQIANRLDGAVPVRQQLSGPDGGPIPWASYTDRTQNEKRIAELETLARMRSGDSAV
jgi:hypothetical protein